MTFLKFAAAAFAAGFLLLPAQAAEKPRKPSSAAIFVNANWADGGESAPVIKAAAARPVLKASARKTTVHKSAAASARPSGQAKGQYGAIIARYASTYGVPAGLAHAVIRVESNYRANARGGAGEIGLMQIKPATARMLGYRGSAAGLFNPETNIRYGMKYLGMAHKLGGGSTCGTILKYNAGHGARRMNPVSAAYCSKVKQHLRKA